MLNGMATGVVMRLLLLVLVLTSLFSLECRAEDVDIVEQVAGGVRIRPKNFKWFTALQDRGLFVCSAVLISEAHVLTANHCVQGRTVSDLNAVVSYYCPEDDNCAARSVQDVSIFRVSPFPNGGDLAILTLTSQVSLTVRPAIPDIVLPGSAEQQQQTSYASRLKNGNALSLIGSGRAETRGDITDTVRKLTVRYMKRKTCRESVSESSLFTKNVVCSSAVDGQPCRGDSGAAVIVRGEGNFKGYDVVVGIHILGPGDCTNPRAGQPLGHFAVDTASSFLIETVCPSAPSAVWCPQNQALPPDPTPPSNQPPSCAPGKIIYNKSVDVQLLKGAPDTAFPTDTILTVDRKSQVLLKFPTLPKRPLEDSRVTRVFLWLFVLNQSHKDISLHRMRIKWNTESTWNFFGNDGVQANGKEAVKKDDPAATLRRNVEGDDGSWMSFDVTHDVLVWQQKGDRNHGWVLTSDSDNVFVFYSSEIDEEDWRPTLYVTYSCWPPPSQCIPATAIYSAPEDTLLRQANPNKTGDSISYFGVLSATNGRDTQVLLKFPSLPTDTPPGSVVTDARLWIYSLDRSSGPVRLHRMNREWSASSATWTNVEEGIRHDNVESASEPSAERTNVGGPRTWIGLDVTEDVASWLMYGVRNEGWAIVNLSADEFGFPSNEASNTNWRPVLYVTFGCSATPPECVEGTVVYKDGVDTQLTASEPNTAGDRVTYLVASGNPSHEEEQQQVLLKFPSLATGISGSRVLDAVLWLFVVDVSVGPLSLHRMRHEWTASSTWNTLGGDGVQVDDVEAVGSPTIRRSEFPSAGGEWMSLSVTSDVAAWVSAGDRNEGWVVLNQAAEGGIFAFLSSESDNGDFTPELHVTYSCWPAPQCFPGTALYKDAVDIMIQEAQPKSSSESATFLRVDNAASNQKQVLLKFPSLPTSLQGATITEATLWISSLSSSAGPIFMYRMLEEWTESSSWNSFGGDGIQNDDIEASVQFSGALDDIQSRWMELNVLTDVTAWLTAESKNEGWAFVSQSRTGLSFSSSEVPSENSRPSLYITFAC